MSGKSKSIDWGLPPKYDPDVVEPSPGKVFIILNGSFSFQSFNKKLQPFSTKSSNRVQTTLTNVRKRGKGDGPSQRGASTGQEGGTGGRDKQILMKFLNLRARQGGMSQPNDYECTGNKVSIEDRKHL